MIIKKTIWTVSAYDPDMGTEVSSYETEQAALDALRGHLIIPWNRHYPTHRMDDDARAALEALLTHDEFRDSYAIVSHEIPVLVTRSHISLTLEAALCVWEWMLDHKNGVFLAKLWGGLGTSAMRHCSMQAGEIALQVYELMESKKIEFHDSYDWEFVPAVLRRLDWEKLTEHNQYNGPAYEPDLEALLQAIMAAEPNSFETPEQRWIEAAERAADKLWKYSDLVTDHEDSHDYAEDPAAWAKRIGEKYDLTPAETW